MEMKLKLISLIFMVSITIMLLAFNSNANADPLNDAYSYWNSNRYLCKFKVPHDPHGAHRSFASSQFSPGHITDYGQCEDGDVTLFNGLLCASGDSIGCASVQGAENSTNIVGKWFRSPKQRWLAVNDNYGGGAQFSADMAYGVELYLVKTGDKGRAIQWFNWLDHINKCGLVLDGKCIDVTPPVWTDDSKNCTSGSFNNCVIAPGAAAALYIVHDYMQRKYGIPDFPSDSKLRGYIGSWSNFEKTYGLYDSLFADPGFSQHLIGVFIYLNQTMGDHRYDPLADILLDKPGNSKNVFYLYLANKPIDQSIILESCPTSQNDFHTSPQWLAGTPSSDTWHWQNNGVDDDWKHSNYWDCIFAAHLVGLNSNSAHIEKHSSR
ncbi:hypothetical protein AAKU67_001888 [Oxalobacteraceae bacterium GrIS 2.11]